MNNNGELLSEFITTLLEEYDLTLTEQATINSLGNGVFIPEDIDLALMDVQILHAEQNKTELIKLARQLPRATVVKPKVKFAHKDGRVYSLSEYMQLGEKDRSVLGDIKIIDGTPCPNWQDSLRKPEENKNLDCYDPKFLN